MDNYKNGETIGTPEEETYFGVAVNDTKVNKDGRIETGKANIVTGALKEGKYVRTDNEEEGILINSEPEMISLPLTPDNEQDRAYRDGIDRRDSDEGLGEIE